MYGFASSHQIGRLIGTSARRPAPGTGFHMCLMFCIPQDAGHDRRSHRVAIGFENNERPSITGRLFMGSFNASKAAVGGMAPPLWHAALRS